ncbi:MAG TPA: diguanylate cyclase [Terriglobales bacterium]|nr:diguanylate cyclase [Terriglobales bacterium]
MGGELIGTVVVPGAIALLLFGVFTYLYRQSREAYFRIWQLALAVYALRFALIAFRFSDYADPEFAAFANSWPLAWLSALLFVVTVVCILISTDMVEDSFQMRARYAAIGLALAAWTFVDAKWGHAFTIGSTQVPHIYASMGTAAVLVYSGIRFWGIGARREMLSYRVLAFALCFWAALVSMVQFHDFFEVHPRWTLLGHVIGPVPQMLLGIAMVMVLFETERRNVQENLLEFSRLDAAIEEPMEAEDVAPHLQKLLDRLMAILGMQKGMICIREELRDVFPTVERSVSRNVAEVIERQGGADCFAEVAAAAGGVAVITDLDQQLSSLPEERRLKAVPIRTAFAGEGIEAFTVASLRTSDRTIGALIFPHPRAAALPASRVKLLQGLGAQIAMTLQHYLVVRESQRRSREYQLLTQIGQAVSSRLDADEVLRDIYKGLSQLFDVHNFYVVFREGGELRFELEVDEGAVREKRSRKWANGISEYIIGSGKPLLAREEMNALRARINVIPMGRPSRSFCGVPIFRNGEPVGVMAVLNYEREHAFGERDLHVLETAAGQLAVAIENARLFAEEQQRARYLAFLNNVSKTAISTDDAERMLEEIVREIREHFHYDHIGIGILDYNTKEIEIKAEAGAKTKLQGKRVPLGVGILGRVARANEMALQQGGNASHLLGVLPDSRSVLCMPLTYGETLLGVLNIEDTRENAFAQQEVLILQTFADLLATALHNAFIFQKMQQQSITDGLTGIKTRRYFSESLSAEWKRASRSGRPFSVVLIDLDKFKQVNDTMGHLEGDLVLTRVGRLLEQKCRQSNVVARYGGDEFVVLMPETSIEQAQILAERLRLWIATDPMLNERRITGSFGVATFPVHGASIEDIIRVADAGMYVSKRAGGNRVSTVEEFHEGEAMAQQKAVVTSYVEGFLRREHTSPDSVDELVQTLVKLGNAVKDGRNTEALTEAVMALTRAAEAREVYCTGHGESVARYAEAIGREMQMSPEELADLALAARVHDIGKIVIPEQILNKAGALTVEEYKLVKKHADIGGRIIATMPGSTRLTQYVRYHHERFDGQGYPDGLKGEQIPLGARIIAVAEVFTNMTLERPYAPTRTTDQALEELEALSGAQFDGVVVRVLTNQVRGRKPARAGKS